MPTKWTKADGCPQGCDHDKGTYCSFCDPSINPVPRGARRISQADKLERERE